MSGLDPTVVMSHEASLLVPARVPRRVRGRASRSSARRPPGSRVLAASLALYCFAAGHGGVVRDARAAGNGLAAAARARRDRALLHSASSRGGSADLGALAAVFGALALVHPTYALFALLPLAGYALVRLRRVAALGARARRGDRADAARVRLAAAARARHRLARPRRGREGCARSTTTRGLLVIDSPDSYRLAAEVVGRTGAVAVAALALVPLAGPRRAPPALGRVRARRDGARAGADARARALHALLRRRLALAVAPRRHKVDFIIGDVSSSVTLAMQPVVEDAGVLLLNAASSNPKITYAAGVGGFKWTFRNYPTDETRALIVVIQYAVEKRGFTKFAVLSVDSDYRHAAVDFTKKYLPGLKGAILTEDYYREGEVDFRSVLAKIRDSGAQAIIMYGNADTFAARRA